MNRIATEKKDCFGDTIYIGDTLLLMKRWRPTLAIVYGETKCQLQIYKVNFWSSSKAWSGRSHVKSPGDTMIFNEPQTRLGKMFYAYLKDGGYDKEIDKCMSESLKLRSSKAQP